MKLTAYSEVVHKDKRCSQLQRLEVVVEYNYEDDTIDEVLEVNLYVDNIYKADISTLLDKCEGWPLDAILKGFNWREIYRNQQIEI